MKSRIHLAILLAALLPIALSAKESSDHDSRESSNRSGGSCQAPASVPDTASTLLLLGAGLGGLMVLKKRFSPQAQ